MKRFETEPKNKEGKLRLIMDFIEDILEGIDHWFIGSIVLGFVREGKFIKNEHDLDYIVRFEDTERIISRIKEVFKEKKQVIFSQESAGENISIRYVDGTKIIRVIKIKFFDSIDVDFFIGHTIEDSMYFISHGDIYAFHKYPLYLFKGSNYCDFEGGRYPMPTDPLEFVVCEYGNDWQKKKGKWDCCVDPSSIVRDKKEFNRLMNIFHKMSEPDVVLTFGIFDLWHIGHLNVIERAKSMGKKLVVGVGSNYSVNLEVRKKLKPYYNLEERLRIVSAQKDVDWAFSYATYEQLEQSIRFIKPDLYVRGDDWIGDYPGAKVIKELNIPMKYLPYTKGISTTKIKEHFGGKDENL